MAGERGQYQGSALQAIDGKGRVAIPANLRATIERNATDRLVLIAPHESDACLSGYDRGWSEALASRIDRQEQRALDSGGQFDRHATARQAFAMVDEVPFDASGRFILPPFLRRKAQLDDLAVFVGALGTFEIWNPQVLLAAGNVPSGLKEKVEYLLAERAAA